MIARSSAGHRSESGQWVMRPLPRPLCSVRLFCFPYAGGSASAFYEWAKLLPPEVELCGIQPPGRDQRLFEPAFDKIDELVPALTDQLIQYVDRPFAFFGHSKGAIVAFETFRHLRARADPIPIHLFASGAAGPQRRRPRQGQPHRSRADLVDELRRLNGTPEELLRHSEFIDLVIPAIRADFALLDGYRYRPEPPLDVSITAYGGLDDPDVTPKDLSWWSRETSALFRSRLFDGDHFFIKRSKEAVICDIVQSLAPIVSR